MDLTIGSCETAQQIDNSLILKARRFLELREIVFVFVYMEYRASLMKKKKLKQPKSPGRMNV